MPCGDEAVHAVMPIDLTRRKARGRIVRPIKSIRPDLRFKACGVRMAVQAAAFAGDRAVEIISGIDLHAGLIGQQLEDPSRPRRLKARSKLRATSAIQAESVIVSLAAAKLLVM